MKCRPSLGIRLRKMMYFPSSLVSFCWEIPKSESISKKGQIIKEVDFFSQEKPKCNLIIDFAKEEVINEIVIKHE